MNSNYVAEIQSINMYPHVAQQLVAGQHVSVNICVSEYKLLVRVTCCPGVNAA